MQSSRLMLAGALAIPVLVMLSFSPMVLSQGSDTPDWAERNNYAEYEVSGFTVEKGTKHVFSGIVSFEVVSVGETRVEVKLNRNWENGKEPPNSEGGVQMENWVYAYPTNAYPFYLPATYYENLKAGDIPSGSESSYKGKKVVNVPYGEVNAFHLSGERVLENFSQSYDIYYSTETGIAVSIQVETKKNQESVNKYDRVLKSTNILDSERENGNFWLLSSIGAVALAISLIAFFSMFRSSKEE